MNLVLQSTFKSWSVDFGSEIAQQQGTPCLRAHISCVMEKDVLAAHRCNTPITSGVWIKTLDPKCLPLRFSTVKQTAAMGSEQQPPPQLSRRKRRLIGKYVIRIRRWLAHPPKPTWHRICRSLAAFSPSNRLWGPCQPPHQQISYLRSREETWRLVYLLT